MSFVEKPIINSPFLEPTTHYARKGKKFVKTETRRPSGYWVTDESGESPQEVYTELELVNSLREAVKQWREEEYRGATQLTKQLLTYWFREDRVEKRIFFCQQELIEAIIWLVEVASENIKVKIPIDKPLNIEKEVEFAPFPRYCGKMATGTGKTVVMACLIVWQVINSLMSPGDPRFTSNILVVTPNRTVRQRDYTALDPTHEENYYMSFNLVPNSLHKFLFQGNIFITNWHYFLLKDDSGTKSVVKKGKESKEAFVRRVTTQGFTRFYRNKKIFVLNDEAHHAYRPSPDAIDKLRKEQERKLLNKVQEFEELIQAIDQGPEHLEKLKQSSVKKDNDLAKKIEKISKSEEIELRRKIKDFHELYEVSIVADALIKGDAHLKTMSTSKNPQDRDVVKKIQAMSDAERKAIKGRYEELGSTMLEMLSETLSLDNDLVEATVWVGGLDLINNVVGINFCVDLTATPFYNKDSGFPEGTPFPWIVTDFSLADAIESGLVKIPRYPIKDNAAEEEARYYRLWETIKTNLEKAGKKKGRALKPEDVVEEAQDALMTLASQWRKTKDLFDENRYNVPPLMIIVCQDTKIAKVFYEAISQGESISEFKNDESINRFYTLQVDSTQLNKAEAVVGDVDPSLSKEEAFRELVSNVGKKDTNGGAIRCVISVGMLSEGWDAHNVTQILGVRAFTSTLLCEQVIGRGLRRMNYHDFTVEEYVDVYGIPFDMLPTKGEPSTSSTAPKPTILVKAETKKRNYEIRFPRVESYLLSVDERIKIDFSKCTPIKLDPKVMPTQVELAMYLGGTSDEASDVQDRSAAYKRLQTIKFHIANDVVNTIKNLRPNQKAYEIRYKLFPQVFQIVEKFIADYIIEHEEAKKDELMLFKYKNPIVEQLSKLIEPDDKKSTRSVIPRIERFRPWGSSKDVLFRTARKDLCEATGKSHVNYVVCSSGGIKDTKKTLESNKYVFSYVRNEHLGFGVPKLFDDASWSSKSDEHVPDFIFTIIIDDTFIPSDVDVGSEKEGEKSIILTEEEKNTKLAYVVLLLASGLKDNQVEEDARENAVKQWIEAINNVGGFGTEYGYWTYIRKNSGDDLNVLIENKRNELVARVKDE